MCIFVSLIQNGESEKKYASMCCRSECSFGCGEGRYQLPEPNGNLDNSRNYKALHALS